MRRGSTERVTADETVMTLSKIERYIGLCRASRKLVCGTSLVLDAVRRSGKSGKNGKNDMLVLLALDASERTRKQVTDKCAFYGVRLLCLPLEMDALSRAAGKSAPAATMAVTDAGFAAAILAAAE